MNEQEIIQEFKDAGAILSGHFVLSSGLHSSTYLQCARVLTDAKRGERLCSALADKVKKEAGEIDVIADREMRISASRHVPGSTGFVTDETFWKVVLRVDGQPLMTAPITPYRGANTLSAFIVLTTTS